MGTQGCIQLEQRIEKRKVQCLGKGRHADNPHICVGLPGKENLSPYRERNAPLSLFFPFPVPYFSYFPVSYRLERGGAIKSTQTVKPSKATEF